VLVEVNLIEPAEAVERLEERKLWLFLRPLGRAAKILDQDARSTFSWM
jgi:hypothetical protein